MYFLRFACSDVFYFFIPIFCLLLFYRLKFYRNPVYSYSLTSYLNSKNIAKRLYHREFLFFLRSIFLLLLIFLIARPQWVDSCSKVNIEGIDIVLAMDVSGSMRVFDDLKDQRSRIEVAKDEAIRFIEKRTDDPIGVVIFAKDVISRCPLTLDKYILKEVIQQLHIGYIDPNGTSLGTGLATAVNRLRNSKAKSKVAILLTDGVPTPEKIDVDAAIDLAKQFGIKVYTIGIGTPFGGYVRHRFGIERVGVEIDVKLLDKIAKETGGQFFRASNQRSLRNIYDRIDRLEKTEYQTDLFHNYYEAFLNFIWILLLVLFLELLLSLFIWPTIC